MVKSFAQFMFDCGTFYQTKDEQRVGQYFFNQLVNVHPELAEKVRTSSVDPFYNDKLIHKFVLVCEQSWDDIEKFDQSVKNVFLSEKD
jgi:hypothetical protein